MPLLRADDGDLLTFDPARWHAEPDGWEELLLDGLVPPVLDIGCGPGRVVAALARRAVPVLGVDSSPRAVALARQRGGTVLERSVFERLPAEGRWSTVLLLDGNVGIGGDALLLLRRCRALVAPAGEVVVEVEPPGYGWRTRRVRIEHGTEQGPWFAWDVVGADAIAELALAAGLRLRQLEGGNDRWFAYLAVN